MTLNRPGLGNASVAFAFSVAIAAAVAALATTGAAAAAGIAVLLTSAAVVTGRTSGYEPCWASDCTRQDRLSSELVLPAAQCLELDTVPSDCKAVKVRRVRFNLTQNTVHEITPYSEVYGMHPRLLGIQKGASSLEPLDEDDPDERWSWLGAKVAKFWPLLALATFWFSALGPSTLLELAPVAAGLAK